MKPLRWESSIYSVKEDHFRIALLLRDGSNASMATFSFLLYSKILSSYESPLSCAINETSDIYHACMPSDIEISIIADNGLPFAPL